jgi:hypothetical protein
MTKTQNPNLENPNHQTQPWILGGWYILENADVPGTFFGRADTNILRDGLG